MLHSEFKYKLAGPFGRGFTLVEVTASIVVLAIITSTVLITLVNCRESAIDLDRRSAAFALARDNMEKLLAATELEERLEYGDSEDYHDMSWETRVETFYEPHTQRMWLQAVCSASYTDSKGEMRTVELTQWLTDITARDIRRIMRREEEARRAYDEQYAREAEELYALALEARGAAETDGYAETVELSRQLIEYYPDTAAAEGARRILRELPAAVKEEFDIRPYEIVPRRFAVGDIPAIPEGGGAAPPGQGPGTPPGESPSEPSGSQERIGDYTWAELDEIYARDPDEFWRIIIAILFSK